MELQRGETTPGRRQPLTVTSKTKQTAQHSPFSFANINAGETCGTLYCCMLSLNHRMCAFGLDSHSMTVGLENEVSFLIVLSYGTAGACQYHRSNDGERVQNYL